MKKIFYTFIFTLFTIHAYTANAQCPAGRYNSNMFGVTKSTVTYSTPYNLLMDIYQPTGDTIPARPLIILAHGGSFIGGTRYDDITVDTLCVRFARRGYITASIDYRLGTLIDMVTDSTLAIDIVIKAIADGKAAIRYFVKDAQTTNTYHIDTNNIFIGGNSAGAVLYMHAHYLDSLAECPPYIATAMAANGGFDGNSGNAGYTYKTKAAINLAGAVNLTSFINPNDKASVNAHGTTDVTVPYNCGYPLSGTVLVNLCGLGALEPVYTTQGVYHWSKVFPGDAHVPWSSNPTKLNTVDSFVKEFLYTIVCPSTGDVSGIAKNATVSLYPNPASNMVNISSPTAISDVTVYDQTGRTLSTATNTGKNAIELNTRHYPSGIYFVRVRFIDENISPIVKRLIIE